MKRAWAIAAAVCIGLPVIGMQTLSSRGIQYHTGIDERAEDKQESGLNGRQEEKTEIESGSESWLESKLESKS